MSFFLSNDCPAVGEADITEQIAFVFYYKYPHRKFPLTLTPIPPSRRGEDSPILFLRGGQRSCATC